MPAVLPRRLYDADRRALSTIGPGKLLFDEPLARHTTFRIGGPADVWFEPETVPALHDMITLCVAQEIPMAPMGVGANVLVRDGGIRGVVLSTHRLNRITRHSLTMLEAEAGVTTSRLLHCTLDWGLGALEFLGGVPGSVGGGLIMNAGTYLGEFKDVVTQVASIRLTDAQHVLRGNHDCGFGYRRSALGQDEIVVSAIMQLVPRPRPEIAAKVTALRRNRRDREPKGLPNAGSIFKNPPGDFAGRLIEQVGLKGTRIGNAMISPLHANWIVNLGHARADDVLMLVALAQDAVQQKLEVKLEMEVKVVGE